MVLSGRDIRGVGLWPLTGAMSLDISVRSVLDGVHAWLEARTIVNPAKVWWIEASRDAVSRYAETA